MQNMKPLVLKLARKIPEEKAGAALRALAAVVPDMVVGELLDQLGKNNRGEQRPPHPPSEPSEGEGSGEDNLP